MRAGVPITTATLLALCSCAPRSSYRAAETPLDRAIVLTEQDQLGKNHPISVWPKSGSDAQGDVADSVAYRQLVDENSTVHIRVNNELLAAASPGPPSGITEHAHDLETRQRDLERTIAATTLYMEARRLAIENYLAAETGEGTEATERFFAARREFAAVEGKYLEALDGLFPTEPARRQLETALEGIGTDERPLVEFLRSQTEATSSELAQVMRSASASDLKLRLEAILEGRGERKRAAMHLEGYDAIDAGEVRLRDPSGLDLSPEEREALTRLSAGNRRIADGLRRMKEGQASLRDVLLDVGGSLARDVAVLADSASALRDELTSSALGGRLQRLQAASRELIGQAATDVGASVEPKVAALLSEAEAALTSLLEGGAWKELPALISGFRDLRQPEAGAEELTAWILSIRPRLQAVASSVGEVNDVAQAVREIETFVRAGLRELGPEESERVLVLWETSAARQEIEDVRDLLARVQALAGRLRDAAVAFGAVPALAGVPIPGQVEVPVAEAPDTALQIAATPRLEGDQFTIKATLLRGDQPVQQVTTTLLVQRFGWRGSLKPAVVVLRPDRFTGGSERRTWSTGVAWLWRHSPRGDDGGSRRAFTSALRPAVGPHAMFLNFDPDSKQDIGFGVTLSLLDGVVQAGAGWNPFAQTESDGRYYYSFGSDLFGLLQDLSRAGGETSGGTAETSP
ncbi:MAG: hypothetical protein ACT4PE_02370 [Candidatus Eiseniibacteriota bacterium]